MLYGPYQGAVDVVHDGDTIHVKLDIGFDLTIYSRVRVLGINSPELRTPEGKVARDFLQGFLHPGDKVAVVSHNWDKYGGRIDGEITMATPATYNGKVYTSVSQLMLESGHAVPFVV